MSATATASKGRVLLVEDEQAAIRVVGLALQREGFEVMAATDAAGALGQLPDAKPDAIVTDYRLPGMSGIDLLRYVLRRSPDTPGTGKELVARAIHDYGKGHARPFVAINCGALAETLLESELFGHVRGSFTGAVVDKKGVFEQASGGTIFLDEIGETSPALQVKLLRVLQEGEVRPVGGTRSMKVNARVLAATNRELKAEVTEKRFRQDLFYRLSAFIIHLPALRERRDDIPMLAGQFLRAAVSRARKEVQITPDAVEQLAAHSWPGNVRELENIVERLVISCRRRLRRREDQHEGKCPAGSSVSQARAHLVLPHQLSLGP
jgi:DNA-binding NtrC family response regulator